ncbi:GGDEF domain-containing protein [Nitrosococcus wardiae]|uniref:diguanylate cyclase n=1 Tax=Nitrosococcus wardiae TaxID=1814290 RepID=A0A4P7BYC1_9GAMM|nr:GGDEF domain-containing protein [Nitrosococcus wardiae]QBQ54174.1 GGDEF domain-containing protein [Nitrosococcus wardiae]
MTGILLTALIFIFDCITPPGITSSVPYIGVVFIGLAARSPLTLLLFAGLSSVLIICGILISPDPVMPFNTVMINRALTIVAVWLTASLCYLHLHSVLTLQHLAHRDQLTGVYNRHYLIAKGSEQIKMWQRYQMPFSLIILDIDYFKKINDKYGHVAGDRVLKHIAKLLQLQTRNVDTICRFGGEEFVILLPMVDLDGALAMAQRIQRALSATSFTWESSTFTPTVSMGVAELVDKQWDLDKLITVADMALYQAKTLGRNQVMPMPMSKLARMNSAT